MNVDERKRMILQVIVDEYIYTGEPVGSNAVLFRLNMNVSSATIRNDMAFLEGKGLLEQPHTSAGRVPTYAGFRYYIKHLMTPKPLSVKEKYFIDNFLNQDSLTVDSVVENAVSALEELTNLAVVSKSSMPVFSVITRVEVIPAGRRLYALLIITSSGTVKNKICRLKFDLTYDQIEFFENFINDNLRGLNVDHINSDTIQSLAIALGSYMVSLSPLLHALGEISEEISKIDVDFKGEQNLLIDESLCSNEIVSLLTHKNQLSQLLSSAMDGISVVFGKENESFAVTNSSLIVSSYKANNKSIGSLGVIGPLRIDYAKIIPHIEYITKSMTRMISDIFGEEDDLRKEDFNEQRKQRPRSGQD